MLKVLAKTIEYLRDNDTLEVYEAEGYTLEDGTVVIYRYKDGKSWRDLEGNAYEPTNKGEPEGFIRIV